jgi:hypothetical protein
MNIFVPTAHGEWVNVEHVMVVRAWDEGSPDKRGVLQTIDGRKHQLEPEIYWPKVALDARVRATTGQTGGE